MIDELEGRGEKCVKSSRKRKRETHDEEGREGEMWRKRKGKGRRMMKKERLTVGEK